MREVDGDPVAEGGGSPCPPADDATRFETRTCNKEICPKGITCDASQDVLFFLDASGAAGKDYERQASLVRSFAARSSEKVHVGAIAYGKKLQILSRITAKRDLLDAVAAYSPPAGGSRDSAPAVVMGRTLFADPGVGDGRPKIAVLLLGGAPTGFPEAKKAAKELRDSNVRVVVGLIDDGSQLARDQACSLASTPCEANVEAVKSWDQMAQEPGRFLASLCRNLVYPGPKLAPMDEMMAEAAPPKKKPKKGDLGPEEMPEWMKRQMGIA